MEPGFFEILLEGLQNGESILFLAITFALGLLNVPLVNWLKAILSKAFSVTVDDRGALVIVLGMSILLAVGQLFATGQIETLTLPVLATNSAMIGYWAKFFYKWLHSGKKPEKVAAKKKK